MSDTEILELFQENPERGLEKVMAMYMGLVFTIVKNKLAGSVSPEDIEECVSDIFYELFSNQAKIDLGKGTVKAYLSVLARRRAVDRFREANGRCATISVDELGESIFEGGAETEGEVAAREDRQMVISEIKSLGPPDSEIFIRKYYFGQSTREIARATGIRENTIDKKVSRGLEKLRQKLGGRLNFH